MKESDFYQRHVRKMEAVLHLARIENSIGSGFPDISAAGQGKQFLIETKVTKFHNGVDQLFFEKFQIPFAMKRLRYTENKGMYVMAYSESAMHIYVFKMSDVITAPRDIYKKWTTVKIIDLDTPFDTLHAPFTVKEMTEMAIKMLANT